MARDVVAAPVARTKPSRVERASVRGLDDDVSPGGQGICQLGDQSIGVWDVLDDLIQHEHIDVLWRWCTIDCRRDRLDAARGERIEVGTWIVPSNEPKAMVRVGAKQLQQGTAATSNVDNRPSFGN